MSNWWDADPIAGQAQPKAPSLDPRSRELAIRTVLGEAADEPDEGMAGVAAVIRNRVQAGRYGGEDVPRVVTAKSQFEPWGTEGGRKRMFSYAPDSEPYKRAAAAVDRVWGEGIDPTNGATHFFSPTAQAALGRNVPAWAQGEGQPIGRHTFFAPEGRVRSTDVSAQSRQPATDEWWKSDPPATSPQAPQPVSGGPPVEAESSPADTGGRFTDAPGQSFRGAREGQSPTVATKAEAAKGGFFRGATFNFIDELKALAESGGVDPNDPDGLTAAIGLIKGAYRKATGDPEADAVYRAAVSRERETSERLQEQQPGASLVGEIGGAAATLPVAIGNAARGASLGNRAYQGAKAGAVFGGLSGAGEGTDLESRVTGAATGGAVGGVLGAAAPVAVEGVVQAGRGIASAARPITTAVRGLINPEAEAGRRVISRLEADQRVGQGLAPREFAQARAEGQPVNLMDLGGDNTRNLARSAANTSGEAKAALDNSINTRFEGQGPRVTSYIEDLFGGKVADVEATREGLQAAARRANRPAYARAYGDKNAQSLWDEGFEQISQAPVVQDAIKGATRTGANRAAAEGWTPIRNPFSFDEASQRMVLKDPDVKPNLQFWDHVKRNLDDTINKLDRAGENSAARDAKELRAALVGHLDDLVKPYKDARAGAAKFFGAEDALDAGKQFVRQNMNMDEARRNLAKLSPPERQLFEQGFVSGFIDDIARVGDRRNVLNSIAQSPAAKQKLEMVLGPQRWGKLEARLRVEDLMDLARGAVQGNSTTARQIFELTAAGGVGGYQQLSGDPSAAGSALATWALLRGHRAIDARVARKVGEMLSSRDPQVLAKGLAIVSRNKNMMESLRGADAVIARMSAQQGPGVPALQSMGVGRAEEDQPRVPGP